MLASTRQELQAIATQLLDVLADYQRTVGGLVASRRDMGLYTESSEQFDRGRLYAAALPRVQVVWIELLICRYELMTTLWSDKLVPRKRILELHERHEAALESVRRAVTLHYLAVLPPQH
ncbi:MAG TPA: hypothetical protein VEA40_24375 [Ramlibacter sp.]|nr:hypothetical protein [Ramlibacter sp.]